MRRRLLAIANPTATGGRRRGPLLPEVRRMLAAAPGDWELVTTTPERGAREILAERDVDAYDAVVACGGDGTLSDVAAALVGRRTPLGLLPIGTGNVFAKGVGFPLAPEDAARVVVEGRVETIDVVRVGDRVSLLRAGVGADAMATRHAGRQAKSALGWMTYMFTGMFAYARHPQRRYVFEVDGELQETTAVALLVANHGALGPWGLSVAPDVAHDDGRLDIIAIRRIGPRLSFRMALRAFRAKHGFSAQRNFTDGAIDRWEGTRFVSVDGHFHPHHVDGDPVDAGLHEAQIVPRSLRLIVPSAEPVPVAS